MNSGSSPRAPRYLLVTADDAASACAAEGEAPVSVPPPPPNRLVGATLVPVTSAMICSTGPPGATWMIRKLTTMIPISVGIIRNSRRTI